MQVLFCFFFIFYKTKRTDLCIFPFFSISLDKCAKICYTMDESKY